ncbi:MAG: phosphoribosylaminoimidazolecarboxamide formyltransferase/IMP cyclohydrolase [Bradymonadia bacterium]|jgi:phosphoribosylaminoimidazolecarboxamide formyltransferase/IMP cyclohydrolase
MTLPRRALLSVSNKIGLVPFAQGLADLGFELISTGGTFRVLTDAGVPVRYVTEVTGHPEVFGGRVKTLHPKVHGGILFRRDLEEHVAEAEAQEIAPIDVVACNLYPFQETITKPGVSEEDAIENIDIGGPAMVRAAAKNFASVAVVTSPDDYPSVLVALQAGELDRIARRELALKAFRHTAEYDAAIATYLTGNEVCAPSINEPLQKVADLRYGENPHQSAALYQAAGSQPLGGAQVLQGKALSYNNIVDLDGAVAAMLEFQDPTVVVVKHTNPCGVGRDADSIVTAWQRALAGDPVSAFGGIVAANRTVDAELATELKKMFLEVVAAPEFEPAAREILAKKKNLRLIELPQDLGDARVYRHTLFGMLAQDTDPNIDLLDEAWSVATDRAPTPDEELALRFLWRVSKHVKSNAIVIGNHERTLGVGAGQMSRVDAVHLAVKKATGPLGGSALASDAFFPFRDGVDAAAEAGVKAIIQPGGSKRDQEVIDACDEHGITMVFTGHRHFKH